MLWKDPGTQIIWVDPILLLSGPERGKGAELDDEAAAGVSSAMKAQVDPKYRCSTTHPRHGLAICSRRPPRGSYQLTTRTRGSSGHHQHWTVEERKNMTWSDESQFLLCLADGRVRIWHTVASSWLVSTVQADWWRWWCDGVGNVFLACIRSLDTNWATFPFPKECKLFWRQMWGPTWY